MPLVQTQEPSSVPLAPIRIAPASRAFAILAVVLIANVPPENWFVPVPEKVEPGYKLPPLLQSKVPICAWIVPAFRNSTSTALRPGPADLRIVPWLLNN